MKGRALKDTHLGKFSPQSYLGLRQLTNGKCNEGGDYGRRGNGPPQGRPVAACLALICRRL